MIDIQKEFPYVVSVSIIANSNRIEWAVKNCGKREADWINRVHGVEQHYSFKDKEKAIMFALMWGGS
jgi:hypothetical protein